MCTNTRLEWRYSLCKFCLATARERRGSRSKINVDCIINGIWSWGKTSDHSKCMGKWEKVSTSGTGSSPSFLQSKPWCCPNIPISSSMQLLVMFSIEILPERPCKRRLKPMHSWLQDDLSFTNKPNNDDNPMKSEKSKTMIMIHDQSNRLMITNEQWPFVTYIHRILIDVMDKNASQFKLYYPQTN